MVESGGQCCTPSKGDLLRLGAAYILFQIEESFKLLAPGNESTALGKC